MEKNDAERVQCLGYGVERGADDEDSGYQQKNGHDVGEDSHDRSFLLSIACQRPDLNNGCPNDRNSYKIKKKIIFIRKGIPGMKLEVPYPYDKYEKVSECNKYFHTMPSRLQTESRRGAFPQTRPAGIDQACASQAYPLFSAS
jgi:hypothetical protein